MTVKKLLSIVTISTVIFGSAVGIGIGISKSVHTTGGKKAKKKDIPSSFTEIYRDSGGKASGSGYGIHDNVEFQTEIRHSRIGSGDKRLYISAKGGAGGYKIYRGDETNPLKKHDFGKLLDKIVAGEGVIKQPWSWYKNQQSDLPSEFYFDIGHGKDKLGALVQNVFVPTSGLEHDKETEENVHYDAPVSDFHVDGDKHQYFSHRERDVSTNS